MSNGPNPPRKKPPALGRGLSALLGGGGEGGGLPAGPKPGEKVIELPLERVDPNPYQPRREYDPEALSALALSIGRHGIIQPLVVRPVAGGYQLIAGERRLRASQLAGLTTVPVVVREASDEEALVLALLENLQREDLNPLEEAKAYARLAAEFGFDQGQIAQGVGKDRSTVANSLRLLKLPTEIQDDLCACRLTPGHARAILSLESEPLMLRAREAILAQGLSVRAAERLVKKLKAPPSPPPPPPDEETTYIASLAENMQKRLGSKVDIQRKGKKGRIVIEFYSDDELERLINILR